MKDIDIKNIYWMLAYALKGLNELDSAKIDLEKFDNIYELFAVMMTQELNKQIKRGLHKNYLTINDEISVVKGKILINETIKPSIIIKNKVVCEYDEYSLNIYLNRIIKTAGFYLLKSKKIKDKNISNNLSKSLLYLNDVELLNIKNVNWSFIKYNRNNISYKILINISYFIIDGLLINKNNNKIDFKDYLDSQKIHTLYEKFILEYYRYHHNDLAPSVTKIKWNTDSSDNIDLLPEMKTDIVLTYKNKTLIIDAKCYSSIFQNNTYYDKQTFHSNNLYQIYSYVKNKDIIHNGNVSGLLLYAKTKKDDLTSALYNIDGNIIEISNIDLSSTFENIKMKLENIVEELKK